MSDSDDSTDGGPDGTRDDDAGADAPIDDDTLVALLGDVLSATEPLDPALVDRVTADAFSMGRIDALLVDLLHDSALEASGSRHDAALRTVVFGRDDVRVEVELLPDEGLIRGRVAPGDVTWWIETERAREELAPDEYGHFQVASDGGRVRFVADTSNGTVTTPWVFR